MSKLIKYNKFSNYLIIVLYIFFSYILFFDDKLLIGSKIESFIFYFFIFYILFFLNSAKLFSFKYIANKDKFLNTKNRIELFSSSYPLFVILGFLFILILLTNVFYRNHLYDYSLISSILFLITCILLSFYIFKRKLITNKLKKIDLQDNKFVVVYKIFLFIVLFYLFYQLLIS